MTDDLDPCCAPGTGCRSTRWRDRLQTRLDNSTFHHRWIANGPLWWVCRDCRWLWRAERRDRRS